jgi:hypothetical protein
LEATHASGKTLLCVWSPIAKAPSRVPDVDREVIKTSVRYSARPDDRPIPDMGPRQQARAGAKPCTASNRDRPLSVHASRAVGIMVCGKNSALRSNRDIVSNRQTSPKVQLCMPVNEDSRPDRDPVHPLQRDAAAQMDIVAHRPAQYSSDKAVANASGRQQ